MENRQKPPSALRVGLKRVRLRRCLFVTYRTGYTDATASTGLRELAPIRFWIPWVKRCSLLGLWLSLFQTALSATAAGLPRPALVFPLPVDSYHDQQIPSLFGKLTESDSTGTAQPCCDHHFFCSDRSHLSGRFEPQDCAYVSAELRRDRVFASKQKTAHQIPGRNTTSCYFRA